MKDFADFGIDISGKGSGPEIKTLCPQCSHTRKKNKYPCLSVNIEKGTWICWHCDWRGGLKQGIANKSNPYRWAPKTYNKPDTIKPTELPGKVIEWFKDRGISPGVLSRNKITCGLVYMPRVEKEVNAIQFPYFRNGELVNIKYRDGQKNFRMVSGAERILYGIDDITSDTAIIVEGEMDKLALEVADFSNVLSVPDGAPSVNTKNYESKFDYLESAKDLLDKLKTIILAVDNDEPGQKLEEELARRLGKERCKRVSWPDGCKDANEVLINHGVDVLKYCIEWAKPYPIKGIFEIRDIKDRIDRLYQHGYIRGQSTGWSALDKYYTVRPGEWTLVTGIPSHGKSEVIDALAVNLAIHCDWRFGIYSPENQPLERHAAKLIEKQAGKPFEDGVHTRIDKEGLRESKAFLQDHFFFILPEDESHTIASILRLAKVLVFRKGIKGLVIDPWNELDHSRPNNLTEGYLHEL